MELHELSLSQNRQNFSDDETRLLQFHLSNLEYACGATIDKVFIQCLIQTLRKAHGFWTLTLSHAQEGPAL